MLKLVRASSQDECREMGEILLDLAKKPRDAMWQTSIDMVLARFPAAPVPTIVQAIQEGRARVQRENDELMRTGWHPIQMREKLIELGYTGTPDSAAA
ncbi:hypothetical protein BFL28_11190 [Sphingomonas turrisvirgatae]|uniref:Uncharacterized protein n=2 Tax=Sphingomonas turrisvirgatae TaxID=1888892 RepID=A0A1E3M1X3_9SPHN|nr:hypothetical protein BFL28_11190 [Sphingomonas turrisvirgatae]